MPNTGMLDHYALNSRGRSRVHWMSPWPSRSGYQTLKFSKHLNRQVTIIGPPNYCNFNKHSPQISDMQESIMPSSSLAKSRPSSSIPMHNYISPFHTEKKPTCGYHYCRETDHCKRRIGIYPVNIVAWRPTTGKARAQSAKI